MSLWPHQQQGLTDLSHAVRAGDTAICITSPTGGGKSRMMFERLDEGRSTALYTDRRMLLDQLGRGLDERGVDYGIRAAGHNPRLLSDVQLCMTQTEASRSLKGHRELHRCKDVIFDEAHKQAAGTAQELIERHKTDGSVIIGFTATPLGIGHVYDKLIVAGTNSELRKCGALVPAYHYGPDEPDTKWVGKVAIGEGECGLPQGKRMEFAQRVFGRVVDNYFELNPEQRPAVLFAPGVPESLFFARQLSSAGIPAAHIDGKEVWVDGEQLESSTEVRADIADRAERGEIKVVCNRFVLREGIDWPFIYHGILATVFGSLTSYLQAGGRFLRAHPSLESVVIQDHGGNWHRHGSLNADREWELGHTDKIVAGVREKRIREKKEPEPLVCPRCHACRLGGPECPQCGHRHSTRTRVVLQKDGTLREMRGDIFKRRRSMERSQQVERSWVNRVRAVRNSKKPHVQKMTFAQLEVSFARDHNWHYPPRDMPSMPTQDADWFRPVTEVPQEALN